MIKQLLIGTALFAAAGGAQAITFTAGSNPSVATSPPFGPVAAGGVLGTNYIAFGVDFTPGNAEGYFDDGGGVLAFAGVNSSGDVDLLTDVNGRIVKPGTLTQGVTDYFYAEAGYADVGSLTLTAYDLFGNVIATATNDVPLGTYGRTTFSITHAGIAGFNISGSDTFGVDEIRLDTPTGGVPEAATWAMMVAGFGLVGTAARRRRPVVATT